MTFFIYIYILQQSEIVVLKETIAMRMPRAQTLSLDTIFVLATKDLLVMESLAQVWNFITFFCYVLILADRHEVIFLTTRRALFTGEKIYQLDVRRRLFSTCNAIVFVQTS